MKVVLCFSPVGTTLRIRGRKFPAIVNCTSIDLFQAWPEEALISVSRRFLSEVELISVYLYCMSLLLMGTLILMKTSKLEICAQFRTHKNVILSGFLS